MHRLMRFLAGAIQRATRSAASVGVPYERFLEADFSVLILPIVSRSASEWPTTRPEVYPAHQGKQGLPAKQAADVTNRVGHPY
jgi:hypothetical protein